MQRRLTCLTDVSNSVVDSGHVVGRNTYMSDVTVSGNERKMFRVLSESSFENSPHLLSLDSCQKPVGHTHQERLEIRVTNN
jgi:hypothetical protein